MDIEHVVIILNCLSNILIRYTGSSHHSTGWYILSIVQSSCSFLKLPLREWLWKDSPPLSILLLQFHKIYTPLSHLSFKYTLILSVYLSSSFLLEPHTLFTVSSFYIFTRCLITSVHWTSPTLQHT